MYYTALVESGRKVAGGGPFVQLHGMRHVEHDWLYLVVST